jgi:hypothetical protein
MADVPAPQYPQQAPQQDNPLAAMGQAVNVAQGSMNIMQQHMMLQGKMALGPIMQQAVDPQTGHLDYDKAFVLMSADPRTAFMAPDFLAQGVQKRLTETQTAGAMLDTHLKAQKVVGNELAGLLAEGAQNGNSIDPAKVSAAAMSIARGPYGNILFPNGAQDVMKMIPSVPKDGKSVYNLVQQMALRAAGSEKSLEEVNNHLLTINKGGQQEIHNVGLGQDRIQGTIINTPTVEQRNTPVTTLNAKGGEQITPRGATLGLPMLDGAGQPIQGSGAPGAAPPGGAPAGMEGNPPSPPSPPTTKLGPVEQGLLQEDVDFNKSKQKDLSEAVAHATQMKLNLQEAALTLKDIKPGPGGSMRQSIGQFLAAAGADKDVVDGVSNGSLSASQEFAKLMLQIATSNMASQLKGGGRFTNAEFESFIKANPNLDMDPQAIQKMLAFYNRQANLTFAENDDYKNYRNAARKDPNLHLQDYDAHWQQQLLKHGILKPNPDFASRG